MPPGVSVAIWLAPRGIDCWVVVGDRDISEVCTGVEIQAFVGRPTQIVLHLNAPLEIGGEIDQLVINPKDGQS